MSQAEDIGTWVLLIAGAGLVATLLATEWRVWVGARGDTAQRPRARARFVRRVVGGALLLATVVLMRFPDMSDWPPEWRLVRLGALLGLCLVVLAMALWDFRIVRGELRHEVQGFLAQSALDMRRYLDDLAVENPQLADKLRKALVEEGVSPTGTDRPQGPAQTVGNRPPEARP